MLETWHGLRIEGLELNSFCDVVYKDRFWDNDLYRYDWALTLKVAYCKAVRNCHRGGGVILCLLFWIVHKFVGAIEKLANVASDILKKDKFAARVEIIILAKVNYFVVEDNESLFLVVDQIWEFFKSDRTTWLFFTDLDWRPPKPNPVNDFRQDDERYEYDSICNSISHVFIAFMKLLLESDEAWTVCDYSKQNNAVTSKFVELSNLILWLNFFRPGWSPTIKFSYHNSIYSREGDN